MTRTVQALAALAGVLAALFVAAGPAYASTLFCDEYQNTDLSLGFPSSVRVDSDTIRLWVGTPLAGRLEFIADDVGVVGYWNTPHSPYYPGQAWWYFDITARGGHWWSVRQYGHDGDVWQSSLGYGNHCGTPKKLIS